MKILGRTIKKTFLPMILILMLFATGCSNNKDSETGYDVFYKSTKGMELLTYKYDSETTKVEKLAKELIEQLKSSDNKKDGKSVIPDNVLVEKIEYRSPILDVYFSKEYNEMSSDVELFLRAGLVKTLVQMEGVTYIQLYVDGALAQYSDGTLIGLLDASDFVDDSAAGMDSIQWKEIALYYANERGDKLVKYSEEIAYSKNASLERTVVEKIIKGPSEKNMQATVPATIKVLDITVNERVCYVNLDASFLTEMVNVSAELPVYSIVNTLCSLPGIDSVKILVNGKTTEVYRETVKINGNLTFNYDIVEGSTDNNKVYQGK